MVVKGHLGCLDGTSKCAKGVRSIFKVRLEEVVIFMNTALMYSSMSIATYLKTYKSRTHRKLMVQIWTDSSLDWRRGVRRLHTFWCQRLGVHSIRGIFHPAFKSLFIEGTVENNVIMTHSLHGTVESILIQSGTPYYSITLRTAQRNTSFLKSYQNIREKEGKTEQRIIFQSMNGEASQGEREISPRPSKNQWIYIVEKGCGGKWPDSCLYWKSNSIGSYKWIPLFY